MGTSAPTDGQGGRVQCQKSCCTDRLADVLTHGARFAFRRCKRSWGIRSSPMRFRSRAATCSWVARCLSVASEKALVSSQFVAAPFGAETIKLLRSLLIGRVSAAARDDALPCSSSAPGSKCWWPSCARAAWTEPNGGVERVPLRPWVEHGCGDAGRGPRLPHRWDPRQEARGCSPTSSMAWPLRAPAGWTYRHSARPGWLKPPNAPWADARG